MHKQSKTIYKVLTKLNKLSSLRLSKAGFVKITKIVLAVKVNVLKNLL